MRTTYRDDFVLPEWTSEHQPDGLAEVPIERRTAKPGDKFGELEVITTPVYFPKLYGKYIHRYQCAMVRCGCGKEYFVQLAVARNQKGCFGCGSRRGTEKRRKGTNFDGESKVCCTCGTPKPQEDYGPAAHKKDGLHQECRACCRRRRLMFKYGLTEQDYLGMVEAQGDRCAICGRHSSELNGFAGVWHVDHCHSTGVVRGLLCPACNTSIGKLRDDVTVLQRAIDYLVAHKPKSPPER